ncbi:hypothetical protein H2248_006969 [Termitomyces sp. 'cryptogamus']|nr:hypothetical protein H2248_006969 [Termitomyces sp. 'cryptogamus']
MSQEILTFDHLHSLDNAQASLMRSMVYNHYTGNLSPHCSSGSSSYSSSWGSSKPHSSGLDSLAHNRSANLSMSHRAQSSDYIDSSYPSYIASPPSYMLSEPQRTFAGSQGLYQSLGLSQPGSDDYFMLPPVLTEIPNHQTPSSARASVDAGRGVAWNSPRTKHADILLEEFGWSSLSADGQFIGFNSSWNDSSSSTSSPDTDTHYNYSLEVPSVAFPASRHRVYTGSSNSSEPRRTDTDSHAPTRKSCSHCHATSTPLWRREPNTLKPLCNACGLYLSQRNKYRPQELIDADAADDSDTSDSDASGPECTHCHTHHTSVWRRSKTGAQLCNACGVYYRLRGKDRPLSLKRKKIKPRSKHTLPTLTTLL